MTIDIAVRLLALIEKYDGLIELLPASGGKITLAYNDGQWVVLHDPGKRQNSQVLTKTINLPYKTRSRLTTHVSHLSHC